MYTIDVLELRILEQAAGHLRWKVNYLPPTLWVWGPNLAKLPSFGGYSLENLTLPIDVPSIESQKSLNPWGF